MQATGNLGRFVEGGPHFNTEALQKYVVFCFQVFEAFEESWQCCASEVSWV